MADQIDRVSEIFSALTSSLLDRFNKVENALESDRINSSDSRRRLHDKIDGLEKTIDGLDRRLEQLEKAVTTTNPMFTEYQAYRQRMIGAGMVGRWLWFLGGILLSAAASAAAVYAWLMSHIKP